MKANMSLRWLQQTPLLLGMDRRPEYIHIGWVRGALFRSP
jgi:hypothetical protein